jgi:hypothetical protein
MRQFLTRKLVSLLRCTKHLAASSGVDLRDPFDAMAQIKDYVAFHPDRVDKID